MRNWLKRANWLILAGVLTVVYLVALFWQIGSDRIFTFFSGTTELNAIGDFLAGVFAPLALIWLVAAVLTQRQELNETREQFVESRKVVDAQLKTINSQNDLLQQQHRQAEESAKRTYRLNLFGERYKIYDDLRAFSAKHAPNHFMGRAHEDMDGLAQRASFVFGEGITDWFVELSESIRQIKTLRQKHIDKQYDDSGNYIELYSSTEAAQEISSVESCLFDQLSPAEIQDRLYVAMRVGDD
ncbi:hypothetical protein LH464_15665 [Neorhizobium sp. T786]|uniref:hypothetical protein n=1 Tax=Pseudorhizobium xiangyangii TaxID=2883104 RepID=UPI001CFF8C38|nr:hypothetical protein [Neorhizobium xiangyangii]MCB5203909.1 hypothetical protein [Neorhizobium xiangyangii]